MLGVVPPVWELAKRLEEHAKGMVVPGTLFEEFGFNYIGPIDGHDLESLIPTLMNMKALKGSAEEKALAGQIEGAHFVARAASGNAQSGLFPSRHVFGIGFKTAKVFAPQLTGLATLMEPRAFYRMDRVLTVHFRRCGRASGNRASHGSDNDVG